MKEQHVLASGGCQCGAVRYRFDGILGDAGICHCRMCQKAFGSWGAALVTLTADSLQWTRGSPEEFRSSPHVARGFCRACGTPLYMREDGDNSFEMAIGTLDNPELAPPTSQVGIESKRSWFNSLHKLPAKTTSEKSTPEKLARYDTLQHPDQDTEMWPPR